MTNISAHDQNNTSTNPTIIKVKDPVDNLSSKPVNETTLTVKHGESLPLHKSIFLGLQHVLAMDLYVVPFVITSILGLGIADSSKLIQSTFLAAGIATIIQALLYLKISTCQGPSYVPIGATVGLCLSAGGGYAGLSTVFGSSLVAAGILIGIGYTGLFHKVINFLVPRLVGGTIITVIGLSLLPVALSSNIYAVHGKETVGQNLILTLSALITLIASIPEPVIGGVFVVVCAIIMLSGVRILRSEPLSERNMFVIGVPIVISLALFLIPADYVKTLPQILQYILGSTIATAAIVAIILNKLLPKNV